MLINQSILSRKRKKAGADKGKVSEDAMVNACFSFVRRRSPFSLHGVPTRTGHAYARVTRATQTIRRDSYGIPSMIVGNFIRL